MNGNGPSQSEGVLTERALYLRLYLLRLLVEYILRVLPFHGLHLDVEIIIRTTHGDALTGNLCDMSDLSVEESVSRSRIILYEHHLCPLFQHQFRIGGISIFREGTFNLRLEGMSRSGQSFQLLLIILLCHVVMGGQTDIPLLFLGTEVGLIALVQLFKDLL